jgi:TolB protein
MVLTRLGDKQLSGVAIAGLETPTNTFTLSPTNSPTVEIPTFQPSPIVITETVEDENNHIIFISIMQDGKPHIFVYNPGNLQFTRLFNNDYEEIHPSISPNGSKLAYSAKKNGYWDIYVLDLNSGQEIRITDSPEYDGNPTWSPDSQFLAYESYNNRNLDIFIQPLNDPNAELIQLTESTSQEFSPSWSPTGRQIAYVSTISGEEEIWLARLDVVENRFSIANPHPSQSDLNPSWSSDGSLLTWSSQKDGFSIIYKKEMDKPDQQLIVFSEGNSPVWFANEMYYIQGEANEYFMAARESKNGNMIHPSLKIPGQVNGFSITQNQDNNIFLQRIQNNDESSSTSIDDPYPGNRIPELDRAFLQPIDNVEAPYPYLSSMAFEKFQALRNSTIDAIGWDFLNTLNNAFMPITEPKNPGNAEDWLLTGRAFEFNPLILYADLAVITQEERNGQLYWRVFLKTRYQDGSQGIPLKQLPWHLELRYEDNPSVYESGGERSEIPEGYYVDFTSLALSLGWERLPVLANWRTFFNSARFNQFVLTDQLDWHTAMRQIYPEEAILSPTPLPSLTTTPTLTPTIRYFRSPTATNTPDQSVATLRPTWTPFP